MNEIAFTLFCGCTICLTLQVGIAIYTVKVLERSKDFMSFAWNFTESKLLEREYQRGRKDASEEYEEVLKEYKKDDISADYLLDKEETD